MTFAAHNTVGTTAHVALNVTKPQFAAGLVPRVVPALRRQQRQRLHRQQPSAAAASETAEAAVSGNGVGTAGESP